MIALLATCLLGCAAPRQEPPPPNVLVILLDDVGHPERQRLTFMDALAAQGYEFTRAYCPGPVCATTRLAMQTGMWPRRLSVGELELNPHVNAGQERIPFAVRFLPELLAPTHDAMLFGKWHGGRALLFGEMNQVTSGPYCQGWGWRAGVPAGPLQAGGTGHYNWYRVENGDGFLSVEYTTDAIVSEFNAWLGAQTGPWLAWFAPNAPHSPYDPAPGHLDLSDRENYEGAIDYLNQQILAILAALPENTIVVATCDNGTPPDVPAPGYLPGSCKFTLQECGIRVPLVMAGPGIQHGVSDRMVSLLDLPATVAELLGVKIRRGFEDSRSFADTLGPWLGGAPRDFVFAERYSASVDLQTVVERQTETRFLNMQEVMATRWKLRREDADGSGPLPSVDLYFELISDPMELAPVPFTAIPSGVRTRLLAELASLPPRQ